MGTHGDHAPVLPFNKVNPLEKVLSNRKFELDGAVRSIDQNRLRPERQTVACTIEQVRDEPQHPVSRSQRLVFRIGQHEILVHERRNTLNVPVVERGDVRVCQSPNVLDQRISPCLMSTTSVTGARCTL